MQIIVLGCGISLTNISNMFRAGKKSDRARPLIVKFCDIMTKNSMKELTFGKKLTMKTATNEIISVTASHDRTPKQREENKKLQSELLRKKQETGDDSLIIRNGKITKDFLYEPRRLKATWAQIAKNLS